MSTKQKNTAVYVDGGDLGEEIELSVDYQWCPAEPDVGIFQAYLEVDGVKYCGHYIDVSEPLREVIESQIKDNYL